MEIVRNSAYWQDVVRKAFTGKTVVMVAHRLDTVIDCDQVGLNLMA